MGSDNNADVKQAEIDKLKQEAVLTRKKKIFYDNLRKTVPLTGIIVFSVLTSIYFILGREQNFILGIGIFYFVIAILYPITDPGKTIGLEIDALESEISLRATESGVIEERAERLFKSHEIDLKKYYDLALKQNNSIFIVGIFSLLIGFAFIGTTLYLIYSTPKPVPVQILLASLGGLSGLLTNFIGIIYLKMFSETMNSFNAFHNKLVTTNHLHFINFLISKIGDSQIRNETIKAISEKVSENIK